MMFIKEIIIRLKYISLKCKCRQQLSQQYTTSSDMMMKKEIQMTTASARDNRDSVRDSVQEGENSESKTEEEQSSSQRKWQPLLLYFLVVLCELITIFLSLLLALFTHENKKWVYLTFIVMTVVRSSIFLGNSIYMIGFTKKLLKLYFLLDNTFLVELASVITYIFLNYTNQIEFALGAIICYPILLFFLVGNFRVMLLYCDWRSWQVIIYKMVKIIGSTYFLVYGTFLIIKSSDTTSSDLFMLWVFTTCGFWAEMCFCINTFDASDGLSTKYRLMDE